MHTASMLVCTLLGGDWAFTTLPLMDKARQEDSSFPCSIYIWFWQIAHILKENLSQYLQGGFTSRKFFNLGNKPIMNDDEVGKSLKSLAIGRSWWLIDLKLFHKLGFPPAEGSSFTPISNLSRFTPFWLLSQKVMFTWNKMKKAKVICDKNGM